MLAIALLFRIGEKIPAGALSMVLFLAALAQRIIPIYYQHKFYKRSQDGGGGSPTAASSNMGRKEALEILELDEKATEEEIKKAYKKLMAKVHPDQGGSKYLAAKLNAAKDVLLKKG